MIITYWPIKEQYADGSRKTGGVEGLKNALEYNMEVSKTTMGERADSSPLPFFASGGGEEEDIKNELLAGATEDVSRVIGYMKNDDKIKGRYISGYYCEPANAVEEFLAAKMIAMKETGTERNTGALAYHMVQSFPDDLEISDEEVHQCGVELCKKLEKYQAVICSHVHPVTDEEGIVHGKCKHNHILFNAFIMPDKVDPEHPRQRKFHDCDEMYLQMQVWNDEIAIDHGLPIIRYPDLEKKYSWFQSEKANQGLSWKERIRIDVENARRYSHDWDSFQKEMVSRGYQLKDGKQVTYLAPDGIHRARGATIGQQCTRESLELYWALQEQVIKDAAASLEITDEPSFSEILSAIDGPLAVAVPLGKTGSGKVKLIPLQYTPDPHNALPTYFPASGIFDIYNASGQLVTAASGADIYQYMMDPDSDEARNKREAERQKKYQQEEEEILRRTNIEREKDKKKQYYYNPAFVNRKTGKPYKTLLYDKNGRRRSSIELIYLLAATVLQLDEEALKENQVEREEAHDVMHMADNRRLQAMIDAIQIAREENLHTPSEIEDALAQKGAEYSRIRAGLERKKRTKAKMETLEQAIQEYEDTRRVAEAVFAMPEGEEKKILMETQQEVLARYRNARAVMYAYKVTKPAEIADFKARYADLLENLQVQEGQFEPAKEEYRRLKKLKYSARLAQDTRFVFGAEIDAPKTTEQREMEAEEYWRRTRPEGMVVPRHQDLQEVPYGEKGREEESRGKQKKST